MYKILITTATPNELKIVKSNVGNQEFNLKLDYFSMGIGNYKTILNLTKKLSLERYDFIINIGICGYLGDNTPVQVAKIENLTTKKELLPPIHFKFTRLSSIVTSENIVYEIEKNADSKDMYFDMESYGFELVCDDFKIPRILLKLPYDEIGTEKTKNIDMNEIKNLFEKIDYYKLLNNIRYFLDRYKEEEVSFDKYFSHYTLTFTEKLQFQKLYFKYTSTISQDFDKFFKQNNNLNKEDFLKLEL